MNVLARAVGVVVIGLGVLATVVGLALPWTLAGARHPDPVTVAGIAFLGPLLTLLSLAYARTDPRRTRLVAVVSALTGLAAAAVAVALTRLVEPIAGIGLGGPVTVAGGAATALGWIALAVVGAGPLPRRDWRRWVAAGAVAAVLVVAGGFGVDWAREGRFVDATTAGPSPGTTAQQWPLPFTGVELVGVLGDVAVVRAADGVRAVWLGSGTTAWQYLRSDVTSQAAGLVDGAVVVVFGTGDGVLVAALDAGTGAQRFARRYPSAKMATVRAAGRTAVLSGAGVGAGPLLAIDAGSGDERWRWSPERNGAACDVTDLAATPQTAAVALRCRAQGVDDVAVGLDAATGAERWSWHAVQRNGPELRVFPAADGFVTLTGAAPRRATYMDAVTGSVGSRHDAAGALPIAAGPSVIYAEPSATRPHLTAVEAQTGAVRWDVGLPGLGGYDALTGTAADGEVYVLWRNQSGALRLFTAATTDGSTKEERAIACATRCPLATIAASGPHAVVATREDKSTQLFLTAL